MAEPGRSVSAATTAALTVAAAVIVVALALRPGGGPGPSASPFALASSSPATRTAEPTPEPKPEPTDPALPSVDPPTPVAEDGTFRLAITVPRDAYAPIDAIVPSATLTFLGPGDEVVYGHAAPAAFFTIQQLDGDAQMGGGADDVCLSTVARRGVAVPVAFHKSGQIDLGFDLAWYRDPVLRLPPGLWRIGVQFEGGIPACEGGAEDHQLHADQVIVVR